MDRNSFLIIFKNKVVFYMVTRYVTYAIQFIVSLFIAARLGPFYMGIWGVIQMVVQYFRLVNFGIPISSMVLNVQYKGDAAMRRNYETTSLALIFGLCCIPIACCLLYYISGTDMFDKYEFHDFFIFVCIASMMTYFIDIFTKLATTKGHLFEVAFAQSVIPFLTLSILFAAKEKTLVYLLVISLLIGNGSAILLFARRKIISTKGHVSKQLASNIISKGFFLFMYNTSFYLILLGTKTFVSVYYKVEEFGMFAFAYTLSNAVLLLLEAFSAIVTPKMIDKMNTDDMGVILNTVHTIRTNYIYLSHGLMYFAIIFFPILLQFLPAYQPALAVFNLTALTLVLYTNSFGYISLLMAKNKEKKLARLSFSALLINIVMLTVIVAWLRVPYQYAILSTMFTYLAYAYLCIWQGHRTIGMDASLRAVLKECFPLDLFIPYLSAVIVSIYGVYVFYLIPLFLFCILNIKTIKEIYSSLIIVLRNSNIADVK